MDKIDKALQEKIGFKPHKAQRKILNGMKQYTAICAGTRFGKTMFCAYVALKHLLLPNQHVWIVAPTYDLSKKIYSYLAKWLGNGFSNDVKKGLIKMSDRVGAMKIENKLTKSWIEFKSAENPTSLLGEELDVAILDECPRIKQEIWDSYIYQRLTSRNGQALFIGTPKGKGWFFREFVKGEDPKVEENASFTFTSKDNPHWGRPKSSPQQEWDKAKKRLPDRVFKQEHVAKFIADASQVFRGIDKITSNCLKDVQYGHYYTMGVDLGKYEDFTVLTVVDRNTHQVVHWDRFNKIDYNLQRERIQTIAQRYNNARIIIDSTGVGDPITTDLQRMRLLIDDFKFTNTSKEQLIEKLSLYIERKLITIPENQVLINELESFGYEYTSSKKIVYSAPSGVHDDCVISLALAVWGLFKDKPPAKKAVQVALENREKPRTGSDI